MASAVPPPRTTVYGAATHGRLLAGAVRRRHQLVVSSSTPLPLPPQPAVALTRRAALVALLAGAAAHPSSASASASNPFDKYVKRKKLDPLEAYIPAVLLCRAQFEDLENLLNVEQPEYDLSRSLLRSGPASSLRINIRAVAQYATDDGKGKVASDAVEKCLRALEDLDSLLLHASRKDQAISVKSMRDKITIALAALDSLLQTVPPMVLDEGKAIADAYRAPLDQNEENSSELDPDIKQLEAIL